MEYIATAIIGYLLGSIPTAYIVLKKIKGIDITQEGTKNVGAMNSYEVTDSKVLGFLVFIIDAAKGALSVWLVTLLFGEQFLIAMTAAFFAVLGHCFSAWIKFKGGRGLSTALGALVLFAYNIPALWIIFWVAAFIFRKNIHFSNVAATFLTGAIAIANYNVLNHYHNAIPAQENWFFGAGAAALMVIIMIKHVDFVKLWFFSQKRNVRGNDQ